MCCYGLSTEEKSWSFILPSASICRSDHLKFVFARDGDMMIRNERFALKISPYLLTRKNAS